MFKKLLDNISQDKLLHYMIGTICFMFLSFITLTIAIIGTLILGIGIEIYQKITASGQFELMDALVVWLGGAVVAFPLLYI